MQEFNSVNNISTPINFVFGEKCIGIKLGWGGLGTPESPIRRIDVEGIITSVRGLPNHTNIHKYEFTWNGGRFYTDNSRKELVPFKN